MQLPNTMFSADRTAERPQQLIEVGGDVSAVLEIVPHDADVLIAVADVTERVKPRTWPPGNLFSAPRPVLLLWLFSRFAYS